MATPKKTGIKKPKKAPAAKAKKPKAVKAKVVKAKKPRAAPTAKQKAARANFSAATELAVGIIYDAGKKGAAVPAWGKALRAAYGSGSLSGTRKRK